MKKVASGAALSRLIPCDSQGMNEIKINKGDNSGAIFNFLN